MGTDGLFSGACGNTTEPFPFEAFRSFRQTCYFRCFTTDGQSHAKTWFRQAIDNYPDTARHYRAWDLPFYP